MSYALSLGSHGWNEQAKAQEEARRQAAEAERRRIDQLNWERQRQLFQEQVLQQEQARRGRETDGRLANETLGINKTHDLGKYAEDTKRQRDNRLERMDTRRSDMIERTMPTIFGGQQKAPAIGLYDNAGQRVGGTFGGAPRPTMRPGQTGPFVPRAGLGQGSFQYRSPGFSFKDSLLR